MVQFIQLLIIVSLKQIFSNYNLSVSLQDKGIYNDNCDYGYN